jgi:hypothetical protein
MFLLLVLLFDYEDKSDFHRNFGMSQNCVILPSRKPRSSQPQPLEPQINKKIKTTYTKLTTYTQY